MLKRGLSLLLFLVLLSSVVSAWSALIPDSFYEGASTLVRVSINNTQAGATVITELNLTAPGITITDVPAINGWDSTNTANTVHWENGTVETNVEAAVFKVRINGPVVAADTNLTFTVTKINGSGATAFENKTVTLLNDATPPVIVSINPSNNSNVFSNGNHTISARVDENQSQIGGVTYSYCPCSANATNCTANATIINLTCVGNICNGTADFSSFNEGDYACYTVYAANNVGGNNSVSGRFNFTGQPPRVTGVAPTTGSIYLVGDTVTIAANATDNQTSVSAATATIAYPNGTVKTINLGKSGDRYSTNFVIPNVEGWYNVTFSANDTAGNVNNTQTTQFKAVPVYNIIFSLNPSQAKQGRTVRAAGTVKLANGSDVPETWVTVAVRGTETNRTLTNGTFSYTFSAPNNIGSYNIVVNVYAANGYNYSATKRLRVVSSGDSYTTGYGSDDWGGGYSGIAITSEDSGVAEEPEEPETEDSGVTKLPTPNVITDITESPEQVIDEILNKPGNQITGSAVGTGTGATILALILLLVGIAVLGLANTRIRNHVHQFAKTKVGGKFKKQPPKSKGFSDQEWEEYFKRLKED